MVELADPSRRMLMMVRECTGTGNGTVGLWWYLLVIIRTGSWSGNPGEPHKAQG